MNPLNQKDVEMSNSNLYSLFESRFLADSTQTAFEGPEIGTYSFEDIQAKFNALSSELLPPDRQEEIKNIIFTCENMPARAFMAELMV